MATHGTDRRIDGSQEGDQMLLAPCPSDCRKATWHPRGEGVSTLCVIFLMHVPPQTWMSMPICSWDSPCKTSFLPLAMLALGQRLEALVVCSSSPGPNLPYHWALSLLHTICWHVQWKISISEKAVPLSNTPHQVMSTSGCLSTMALDETELWGRTAVAFAQR